MSTQPDLAQVHDFEWKCHTPELIKRIQEIDPGGPKVLNQPLVIFSRMLLEVAQRASQLNDPILNHLMCRLTLYEVADKYSPEYDEEVVRQVKLSAIEQMNQEAGQAS